MSLSKYRINRPKINGRRAKNWYIEFNENGRSRRISTRQSILGEAEKFLAEYKAVRKLPKSSITIAELCNSYNNERVAAGCQTQAYHLKSVVGFLGNLRPESLTPGLVRDFHEWRRAEGITDSTINRQCRTLRAAFNWGLKEGWISCKPHIPAPPANDERDRFLTRNEALALLAECKAQHLKTFVAIALFTGARAGAILELEWQDVDFDDGSIRWGVGNKSKRRPRVTAINNSLRDILIEAFANRCSNSVISWRGKPVKSVRKSYVKAVQRASIEHVTIHDLRRTAASWLLMNGGTFQDAAILLEDSIETVRRRYARFGLQKSQEITNRLELVA